MVNVSEGNRQAPQPFPPLAELWQAMRAAINEGYPPAGRTGVGAVARRRS